MIFYIKTIEPKANFKSNRTQSNQFYFFHGEPQPNLFELFNYFFKCSIYALIEPNLRLNFISIEIIFFPFVFELIAYNCFIMWLNLVLLLQKK